MTPDSPKLPNADAAVLHGVVERFEASVEKDLGKVEDPSERLRILSKLSEELGAVRNRLSGALRVSLGRIAFVMGLLVVGGAIGVGGTLALQDNKPGQHSGDSRQLNAPPAPVAAPVVEAGSPEAVSAQNRQERAASADATAVRLEANRKAGVIEKVKPEYKMLYRFVKTGKNPMGEPSTDASREADLEELDRQMKEAGAELKEAGLSDADLQSLKYEVDREIEAEKSSGSGGGTGGAPGTAPSGTGTDGVDPKVNKSQFGTSDTGLLITI